jgi:hypothetical protein
VLAEEVERTYAQRPQREAVYGNQVPVFRRTQAMFET